ncbi:MAG: hypothetical protein QHG99_02445 [Methanomicrobiales archaeon]|nr:hypothetical protein [Methanomicrobiales archaeon]
MTCSVTRYGYTVIIGVAIAAWAERYRVTEAFKELPTPDLFRKISV